MEDKEEKISQKEHYQLLNSKIEKQLDLEIKRIDQLFSEREKQNKILFDARDREVVTRFETDKQARQLFAENLIVDKEHLNKLRQEVITDRGMFITISTFNSEIKSIHNEHDAVIKSLNDKLDADVKSISERHEAAFKAVNDKFATNLEGIRKETNEDIRFLRESKAKLEGAASQKSVIVAYIISGISLLFTLINLLIEYLKNNPTFIKP